MELADIEKSATGQEYLYIKCTQCNERVKLAKNKGGYWKEYNFVYDFMIEHACYDHLPEDFVLEWER